MSHSYGILYNHIECALRNSSIVKLLPSHVLLYSLVNQTTLRRDGAYRLEIISAPLVKVLVYWEGMTVLWICRLCRLLIDDDYDKEH